MKNILFLTLKVFSATGGIEKVCRVAGKALYEYGLDNNTAVSIYSMHDGELAANENIYFPTSIFKGFGAAKTAFILKAAKTGAKADVVILSHINLLLAAWLIKKLNPNTTIILMAHGIEIWDELPRLKKMMLAACDRIVSVSKYTNNIVINKHNIASSKCFVLNNCIDPYLLRPAIKQKSADLLSRYNIEKDDIVLLTLTRLSSRDRYKGYDYVLAALAQIVKLNKKVKYILAGGYDVSEKMHIDVTIANFRLQHHVIITGFLPEPELANHFLLADTYIMPSSKEGFGIVFVEAMYYGLPVIAGNADGSTDALLDGKLGLLVKPDDVKAITAALQKIIANKNTYIPNDALLMQHFGYDVYKKNIENILAAS